MSEIEGRSSCRSRASILESAASFWEKDRLEAFRTVYGAMRVVDDIVGDRKKRGFPIKEQERAVIESKIKRILQGASPDAPSSSLPLIFVRKCFGLPDRAFDLWMRSMVYDLRHDGFDCWQTFTDYAEGASVAPGAIFLHLCALRCDESAYIPPDFDVFAKARDLALFCYVVHILRDFRADVEENLFYIDDETSRRHGLDRNALRRIAASGEIDGPFRTLVADCVARGERFRARARGSLDSLSDHLEPRYRFSLEVVYDSYLQMFERLDPSRPYLDRLTISVDEAAERLAGLHKKWMGREIENRQIMAALYRPDDTTSVIAS